MKLELTTNDYYVLQQILLQKISSREMNRRDRPENAIMRKSCEKILRNLERAAGVRE